MDHSDLNSNKIFIDETCDNSQDISQQLIEIQRAMSTSLLTLLKTLEEDVVDGITPEKIPAIRDKYTKLSLRVQELSVSSPPTMDDISRRSSNAALSWASDYFTNIKNVIHPKLNEANILLNSGAIKKDKVNQNLLQTDFNKEENAKNVKSFKKWLKKKFSSDNETTNEPTGVWKRKSNKNNNISNTFTERYSFELDVCMHNDSESSPTKLYVFDSNKMPLTDLNGNILKDVYGQHLLMFDRKGKPLDRLGSPVYDGRGLPSNVQGFTPNGNYSITKYYPLALYNSKGYPLTGIDGHVLLDPSGELLIHFCQFSEDGLILSDKDSGGVWDSQGTPLCPISGRWIDQDGSPYRFFNRDGMPVTDSNGRELYNIKGESLLIRDNFGRPHQVQDTFGVPISAYAFDGTLLPPNEIESFCKDNGNPLRLYNSKGYPLTDEDGRILYTSFGNPLAQSDFRNNPLKHDENINVFDERKLPLFCNPAKAIKNMDDNPLIFYDKNHRPLTDRFGMPLVHASGVCLLKFDNIGRPISDQKGRPICDSNGHELNDSLFDPTKAPLMNVSQLQIKYSGKPGLIIYDRTGRPLTDPEGNALVNSDGTSLEFNIIKQRWKILKQEFDKFLRPLYSKQNKNLYCHGKPIFNASGQKLLDIELIEDNDENFRSGEFNKFGMPIFDKYGRYLFDENGQPLCDKCGNPESEIVRKHTGFLMTVSDEIMLIKIPIEMANTLLALSVNDDGVNLRIPKEYCLIKNDWIISYWNSSVDNQTSNTADKTSVCLKALVRISKMSTMNLVHELLAIYQN